MQEKKYNIENNYLISQAQCCSTECEDILPILLSPPPILRLEYWGYRHETQGIHILKEVYFSVWMFCQYACMCIVCMPYGFGAHKRVPDTMEHGWL